MNETERYRLPRTQERTFIRKPFQYPSVLDRIALVKLGIRGWEMDKDALYKKYKERLQHP